MNKIIYTFILHQLVCILLGNGHLISSQHGPLIFLSIKSNSKAFTVVPKTRSIDGPE